MSTPEEADALAKSVLAQLANAYLEAEGTGAGRPAAARRRKVKIDGVGTRFGGTYALSSTTHVFRGATRATRRTSRHAAARRARLVDLMTPTAPTPVRQRPWSIGVVTQNDDPTSMGRVRVKYPALGDETEGWWARIAAPGAGDERGLLMMPQVGDEVLVAFEHGDVRARTCSARSGTAEAAGRPGQTDGSFALHTEQQIAMAADKAIAITGKDTPQAREQRRHDDQRRQAARSSTSASGELISSRATTSITIEAGASSPSRRTADHASTASSWSSCPGRMVQLG